MAATTISSRAFNQDTAGAKRAARDGPVFITDRGITAYVLLTVKDYRRLAGDQPSIPDLLSRPAGIETIDFDPPISREPARPTPFS